MGTEPQTRPPGRPVMRMQWRHLLFMHWRIKADALRHLIPQQLDIDEFDGSAWVGLIPFTMRDVLPASMPRMLGLSDWPGISAFHECNVRTYVHPAGQPEFPGVWFFSLDAASRAAVWGARRFFHLPYFYSRMRLEQGGERIDYAVDRVDPPQASMRCSWRAGDSLAQSLPGELVYFLTERYMLYTVNDRGELCRCRIWHPPWQLRTARVLSLHDGLVRAAGIEVDQSSPPILHHADEQNVHAWPLEQV